MSQVVLCTGQSNGTVFQQPIKVVVLGATLATIFALIGTLSLSGMLLPHNPIGIFIIHTLTVKGALGLTIGAYFFSSIISGVTILKICLSHRQQQNIFDPNQVGSATDDSNKGKKEYSKETENNKELIDTVNPTNNSENSKGFFKNFADFVIFDELNNFLQLTINGSSLIYNSESPDEQLFTITAENSQHEYIFTAYINENEKARFVFQLTKGDNDRVVYCIDKHQFNDFNSMVIFGCQNNSQYAIQGSFKWQGLLSDVDKTNFEIMAEFKINRQEPSSVNYELMNREDVLQLEYLLKQKLWESKNAYSKDDFKAYCIVEGLFIIEKGKYDVIAKNIPIIGQVDDTVQFYEDLLKTYPDIPVDPIVKIKNNNYQYGSMAIVLDGVSAQGGTTGGDSDTILRILNFLCKLNGLNVEISFKNDHPSIWIIHETDEITLEVIISKMTSILQKDLYAQLFDHLLSNLSTEVFIPISSYSSCKSYCIFCLNQFDDYWELTITNEHPNVLKSFSSDLVLNSEKLELSMTLKSQTNQCVIFKINKKSSMNQDHYG